MLFICFHSFIQSMKSLHSYYVLGIGPILGPYYKTYCPQENFMSIVFPLLVSIFEIKVKSWTNKVERGQHWEGQGGCFFYLFIF